MTVATLDLTFDAAKLSFTSAVPGRLPKGFDLQSGETEPGRVRLRISRESGKGVLPAGTAATLSFRIAAGAGTSGSVPVAVVLPGAAAPGVAVRDTAGTHGVAGARAGSIQLIRVPGRLAVDPKTLDFGTVAVNKAVSRALKVKNTGWEPLEVTVPGATTPKTAPFAVAAGAGTFTLAPQEEREVTVRFTPASRRNYSAKLTITSRSPNGSAVVTLKGRGQ